MTSMWVVFALLSFLVSTAIGYFLISLLWPDDVPDALAFVFAPVTGIGICSILFVIFRRPMFTAELSLLLVLGVMWWKWRWLRFSRAHPLKSWRPSMTSLFLSAAAGFAIPTLGLALHASPHGDWDAMAIWN